MPALHIRGIDERTARRLKEIARRRGTSVNRLAVAALRHAAGTEAAAPGPAVHDDLDQLLGTWSAAEHRAFLRAVEPFERIDEDLWK